jgi:hypothetical protein
MTPEQGTFNNISYLLFEVLDVALASFFSAPIILKSPQSLARFSTAHYVPNKHCK